MAEPGRVRRLLVWGGIGVVGAVLASGVVAHLPPVRQAVLRYVVSQLEQRAGIRLEAVGLDYNLLTLSAALGDVRASAAASPDEPFFEASSAGATLDWSSLGGALRFEAIAVTDGRIVVIQRADGTSNLPAGGDGDDGGPPAALAADLITLDGLAVEYRGPDDQVVIDIPRLHASLTPLSGTLVLDEVASVAVGDTRTVIEMLEGGMRFDGRSAHLTELRVQTDGLAAVIDGEIGVLVADPFMTLRIEGAGAVDRLVRWGGLEADSPSGDLAFAIDLTGPLGDPQAVLVAAVPRLTWRAVEVAAVAVRARVSASGLELDALDLEVAGGALRASGAVTFGDDASARVAASWEELDAAALIGQLTPDAALALSGVLTGTVTADGPLAAADGWRVEAEVRVAAGRNAVNRLTAPGLTRLTLDEGMWRLDAAHRVGGLVPVTLASGGAFDGAAPARSTLRGTARVGEVELPGLLDLLGVVGLMAPEERLEVAGQLAAVDARLGGSLGAPTVNGSGTLTAVSAPQIEARLVTATFSADLANGATTFALASEELRVAGEALVGVRVGGRLAAGVVALAEAAAAQPGGPGRVALSGTYRLEDGRYNLTGTVEAWRVTPTADLRAEAVLDARLSGAGSRVAPAGTGALTLTGARWDGIDLGDVRVEIDADGDQVRFTAAMPAHAAAATGRISVAAPYSGIVDVRAEGTDLARILEAFELPVVVAGSVSFDAHVEGAAGTWREADGSVVVSALSARVNDAPVTLARAARMAFQNQRVTVEDVDLRVGALRVTVEGGLPIDAAAPPAGVPLQLRTAGEMADILRLAEALGVTDFPPVTGSGAVSLVALVSGTMRAPVVAGDLEVGPGQVQLGAFPALTDVRLRAHVEDGWLELLEAGGAYQGARLAATGGAPLSLLGVSVPSARTGQASVALRLSGVTTRVLQSVVPAESLAQMAGILDLAVDLSTPSLGLADFTGEIRLDRFLMAVSGLPIAQREPTRLVAEDGRLRIASWDWTGRGAELAVSGEVRLAERRFDITTDGTLDLRLLTLLLRRAGVAVSGLLRPRLSITGAIDDPDVAGELLLTGGEVRLTDPRLLVSDLTVRAALTRPTARIVEMTGSINGGVLQGTGAVSYLPASGVQGQLTLAVSGMALELLEGLRSEVGADLELRVTGEGVSAPIGGEVSGRVTIARGAYREQISAIGGLLGAAGGRRVVTVASAPGLLDRLMLDIELVTDEDLVVDNNYARLQIGADLRVIGTAGAPALSGRTEIREGGRLFVGRNIYTITAGTIDFANPIVIEPDLNIVATTRAGGEDIQITIAGVPGNITVEPVSTSTPELSRADVQSLLLTGRPLDELSSADAAALGVQLVAGDVLGFAGRAIGLDELRLGGVDAAELRSDSATLATEADPTSRLTFGKSLSARLDLTFSQSLIRSGAQTWILDYELARQVDLRMVSGDDNLRAYSLRHDISFGQAVRARPASASADLRVRAVIVEGNLAVPETDVRGRLRLAAGDRFGFTEWLDDRDRLRDLYAERGYLIARIGSTRVAAGGGVTLTYTIDAGPPTRVRVTGADLNTSLLEEVERAWTDSVSDDFLIEEVEALVRIVLARDGWFAATARVTLGDEGGERVLGIAVVLGARAGGIRARIDGTAPALASQIAAILDTRSLSERVIDDAAGLEDDVVAYLGTLGHLRARVRGGAPEVDGDLAVVPVRVQAGPVFRIGEVRVAGVDALPRAQVTGAASTTSGEVHDLTRTARDRDRLVVLYRGEGFLDVRIVASETVREAEELVDIAFEVAEGPRQILREITVRGNVQIATDAVVRAVNLSLDRPVRAAEWLEARIRLFDTEFFRRVDLQAEAAGPADDGLQPMRAVIDVEEWPALRLRYGFEVSEEQDAADLDARNLEPGIRADVIAAP